MKRKLKTWGSPLFFPDSQARFARFLTKPRFVLTTLVNVGLVTFVQRIRLRRHHLTSHAHAPLTLITP